MFYLHFFSAYVPVMFEKDEAKKKEMTQTFVQEKLTPFMKNLAEALKDNGGQWLVMAVNGW